MMTLVVVVVIVGWGFSPLLLLFLWPLANMHGTAAGRMEKVWEWLEKLSANIAPLQWLQNLI